LSELARLAQPQAGYVAVGAGKTGMNACIWLLEQGVDPDHIRWIMPRGGPGLLGRWGLSGGGPGAAGFLRATAERVRGRRDLPMWPRGQ
jgi:hypothetical protein